MLTNKLKYLIKPILIVIFSASLVSCGKWKKTTTVEFQFEINKSSTISYLNFTGGHILLKEISFSGQRKQGKDVVFHHPVDYTKINFASGAANPSIIVDIPQGTYTSAELEIENREGVSEPSILILGAFTNSMGSNIPLRFEFNSSESFEVEAEAEDGGKEIVLIEDISAKSKIIFDPNYWFGTVTQNMLDNATLSNVSGIQTIVISSSSNEDVYDIIVDRIDDASEAIFY